MLLLEKMNQTSTTNETGLKFNLVLEPVLNKAFCKISSSRSKELAPERLLRTPISDIQLQIMFC